MPVEVCEAAGGKVLEVKMTGKLTKEDYLKFGGEVDRLMKQHGKICILSQMQDFHGWEMGALWEDIKFDFKHFRNIERLAMVGETKWQHGMAVFCKPFTSAKIQYFDQTKLADARKWVEEGNV